MPPTSEVQLTSARTVGSPDLETVDSADGLRRVAQRALTFQRFLLRRAWGVYYAIWSVALAAFFLFPAAFSGELLALPTWGAALYYALLGVAVVVAIGATSWTFRQAWRARRFGAAPTDPGLPRRRFFQVLAIGLTIFAVVLYVASLSSYAGLLVLDAFLGATNLWLLLAVRRWFTPAPPEAGVAIGSWATSVVASAVVLVVTHNQTGFALVWLVATVGWMFSAVYALYHAPEELVAAGE